MTLDIIVKQMSGGYRARYLWHQATSTSGPNHAAQALSAKVFKVSRDQILLVPAEPIRHESGYPIYPCGAYSATVRKDQ
jgi:hypothetical protein